MNIMPNLRKKNGEPTEIELVVKQSVKVAYIKGMEWRLTTKDHTAQGVYVTYQLVWCLANVIGNVNLSVLKHFIKL